MLLMLVNEAEKLKSQIIHNRYITTQKTTYKSSILSSAIQTKYFTSRTDSDNFSKNSA